MKNIELKVKVDDYRSLILKLKELKSRKVEILNQVDTYFNCSQGRLKLREINGKKFELIYYSRPDQAGSKVSDYQIFSPSKKQKVELIELLTRAYGQLVLVRKKRVLWLHQHTRIHLDTVSRLGNYLELETVVGKISMKEGVREHRQIIEELNLNKYKKINVSYSDLLLKKL